MAEEKSKIEAKNVEAKERETVNGGKKKKSRKGIITAILVVIIIVAGIVTFVAYHASQIGLLTTQMQTMQESGVLNADGTVNQEAKIDMEIKTKGGYAVVEQTMKDYLNETLTLAQQAETIYNQEEIEALLSVENIQNDGPEFTQTKTKITQMRTDIEEYIDRFIELCNEENLLSAIDDKDVGNYYKELYKQLVVDDEAGKELEQVATQLEEAKGTIISAFDYIYNIVEFLSQNSEAWTIQNGQIAFYDQNIMNEYNELILNTPDEV